MLGADGAAVATCRPQRWVGRGASVRFEAGHRRFAFRLETADAARALLLLLDDYAAAAWAERPPRPRLEKPKRRDSLTALYEGLVAAIIRPPRAVYDAQSLGPTSFELEGSVRVLRRDVALRNIRRERLVASHWAVDDAAKRPCVIFCHANSASRVQAVHYLALLLSLGCSVLALDFAGAGLSEGDVVTLGFREADDIAAAVQFLRGDARVSRIAGWGSSAGAAALLFCMAKYDAALACCVLDGSYADVRQVAACVEINQCVGCEDDAMIQHEHAVKFDFYTGCGGAGRAEHGRRVFGAVARRAGRHRAPRRERARARRRHARRPPARGARTAVPRARALPSRHGRRPARRPAVWKSTSASGAPENSSLSHVSANAP